MFILLRWSGRKAK